MKFHTINRVAPLAAAATMLGGGLALAALAPIGSATAVAEPMRADGPGCTDRAITARLTALRGADPAYFIVWAEGVQDGLCRGYSSGLDVTVDERSEGLACVRAPEDKSCHWVADAMAPPASEDKLREP
jgi:hypothetical protein